MSVSGEERTPADGIGSDRLVVFCFFLVGSLAVWIVGIPPLDYPSPRLVLSGLLALMLLLSLSALGGVLLPPCALLFGALAEHTAGLALLPIQEGFTPDTRLLCSSFLLVPIFYVLAVQGMNVSASFQAMLRQGGPTARILFQRKLLSLAFFALLGFAVIFYFF